ncbi:hypothetical protein CBS101457_000284 [Exobasidium rhododendri]|nr:hypothetical protein CBS101457_000284 [Exobasidium rhododendri]
MDGDWPFRQHPGRVKVRGKDHSHHRSGLSEAQTARPNMQLFQGQHHHGARGAMTSAAHGDHLDPARQGMSPYGDYSSYGDQYQHHAGNIQSFPTTQQDSQHYGSAGDQFGVPLPHQFEGTSRQDDSNLSFYNPDLLYQHQGGGPSTETAQTDNSLLSSYDFNSISMPGQEEYYNNLHGSSSFSTTLDGLSLHHGHDHGHDQTMNNSSYHPYTPFDQQYVDTEVYPNQSNEYGGWQDSGLHNLSTVQIPSQYDTMHDQLPAPSSSTHPNAEAPPVEDRFSQYDSRMPIWSLIDMDTKKAVDVAVSKRRGLRYDTARKVLRGSLTQLLMMKLLSGNVRLSTEAVDEIFRGCSSNILPLWMDPLFMSEAQCDALVDRMCEVTGHDEEIVRNLFLRTRLTSIEAKQMLLAPTDHLSMWAANKGLALQPEKLKKYGKKKAFYAETVKTNPYQLRLTTEESAKVVQIVKDAIGFGKTSAYAWLKRPHVFAGYGEQLLKSKGEYRASLLHFLKKGEYLPVTDGSDQLE